MFLSKGRALLTPTLSSAVIISSSSTILLSVKIIVEIIGFSLTRINKTSASSEIDISSKYPVS